MKKLLIISDFENIKEFFKKYFEKEYSLAFLNNIEELQNGTLAPPFDYIFIDLLVLRNFNRIPYKVKDYKQFLAPLWKIYTSAQILILSGPEETRECVQAIKAGADNYLTYPLVIEEVKYTMENEQEIIREKEELNILKNQVWNHHSNWVFESKSPPMQKVFELAKTVGPTKTTVLIMGETGTGKGVLSRLIHQYSNRPTNRFISVHCGSIPDTLIESELFGHEKGSFTGAHKRKLGKFEVAHEGTIFLDEIGTVSSQTQIKLLQVIQERTLNRVGSEEHINIDVRIIAATNINLKDLVREKTFREDLFFRLNVFPITIPPLRTRKEDIPDLAMAILNKLNSTHLKDITKISPKVMESFLSYPWPGNIRELENLLERAYILESTDTLRPESFPAEIFEYNDIKPATVILEESMTLAEARKVAIESVERNYLKEVLKNNLGKINRSAEQAGITPRQLHKLISKHGIDRKEFKLTDK